MKVPVKKVPIKMVTLLWYVSKVTRESTQGWSSPFTVVLNEWCRLLTRVAAQIAMLLASVLRQGDGL